MRLKILTSGWPTLAGFIGFQIATVQESIALHWFRG